MRRFALTLALAGAATLAALVPAQAGAIQPAPLGAAIDETALVEPVHCRPGWGHHSSFRRPDGCDRHRRVYRSYPRYYSYGYAPYYAQPYPYAYGYSPGITFGFSFGPRHYRHW